MEQGARKPQALTAAEFSTDFVAGLFGGSAGLVVGHPFDTVKVILQTTKSKKLPVSSCVHMILKQEGARGFFKGMAYPLASVGFLNSIFFGFNMITESLIGGVSANRYSDIFIAGGIAGCIQAIPATPIELVKVKLQGQLDTSAGISKKRSLYRGPWDCLHRTYHDFGVRGCFRGISSTLIRDVTGYSVYMTIYKYFCDHAIPDGQVCPSFRIMLVSGGIAGVVSWALNFPIDTVKSIMQKDSLSKPLYNSTLDCIVKTYRNHGVLVFYKGFWAALVRAFPLNAVTLCIYDWTQQQLKKTLRDEDTTNVGIQVGVPASSLPEVQCHIQET